MTAAKYRNYARRPAYLFGWRAEFPHTSVVVRPRRGTSAARWGFRGEPTARGDAIVSWHTDTRPAAA